jgi:hypothetical protein
VTKKAVRNEESRLKARKPQLGKNTGHWNPYWPGVQQQVGNRAVQRLLIRRSGTCSFDLDDETAERINRQRGSGQALDAAIQKQAGAAMGHDLSGVRVHTSPEADDLSRQLGAKAFTTGQDVFFREGAYDPGSSSGQELIAHELTHIVQQSTGAVGGGGGRMTVNPPGDAFEQEADAVAQAVISSGPAAEVQRQVLPEEEEEEAVQMQTLEEEEEEQALQMQELEEEEEELP